MFEANWFHHKIVAGKKPAKMFQNLNIIREKKNLQQKWKGKRKLQ